MESQSKKITINELKVGRSYTFNRTITQEDIQTFITLTGDNHPLHSDSEYASSCGYDDVLVHGMLVSSLMSTLVGMHLPGYYSLLLSQKLNYKKPVYPGNKLSIKGSVQKIKKALSLVVIHIEIHNNDEVLVCDGELVVKIRDF